MNGGAFGTGVPWGVGAGVGGGPAGTGGVAGVGAGGLGMKPVSVRMSKKDVWLGTKRQLREGKFSRPTTSGT